MVIFYRIIVWNDTIYALVFVKIFTTKPGNITDDIAVVIILLDYRLLSKLIDLDNIGIVI